MNPFQIYVHCYSGYKADEKPTSIIIKDKSIEVIEVLDMWLAPDHRYFKILGSDNSIYIIRNDTHKDLWELTFYQKNVSS